jgi:hypothetical protein
VVNKTLILVHGRGFKPGKAELEALWLEALRSAVTRDFADPLPAWRLCRREFVYYGDEVGSVLERTGRQYDAALDLADLKNTLVSLAALAKTRQFRREHYERLPGKSPLKEFLADIGAPALSVLGLKDRAVGRFLPELLDYWRPDGSAISAADARLCDTIGDAIERGDDILLVSHCIGSVLAYNALWALSRGGYRDGRCAHGKIALWLTLGSPLGDETVKHRLADGGADRRSRYPNNIVAWINVAAEDDFVCHDQRIADDYHTMLDERLLSHLEDVRIYNMAMRYGRSNPHNVLGYLMHPRVSQFVGRWLGSAPALDL